MCFQQRNKFSMEYEMVKVSKWIEWNQPSKETYLETGSSINDLEVTHTHTHSCTFITC